MTTALLLLPLLWDWGALRKRGRKAGEEEGNGRQRVLAGAPFCNNSNNREEEEEEEEEEEIFSVCVGDEDDDSVEAMEA